MKLYLCDHRSINYVEYRPFILRLTFSVKHVDYDRVACLHSSEYFSMTLKQKFRQETCQAYCTYSVCNKELPETNFVARRHLI